MFKDLSVCSLKNKCLTLRVKLFNRMHSLLQHEVHHESFILSKEVEGWCNEYVCLLRPL